MPFSTQDVIECPVCKQKLIASAVRCHFCGAYTTSVMQVPTSGKKVYAAFETPAWIEELYKVLGACWIANGLLIAGAVLVDAFTTKPVHFGFGACAVTFFGVVVSIVGVGLLQKLRDARNIVNWAAYLFGLYSIRCAGLSFAMILGVGFAGFVPLLWHLFNLALAGATIWLLSETETDFTS